MLQTREIFNLLNKKERINFCILIILMILNSGFEILGITSIIPIIIFAAVNLYLILEIYKTGFNLSNNFNLYLGLDELINLFSNKNYIILFWLHFLAINLFCGCWIVKDYLRNNMPKFLVFIPLLLTYFIGPLGIFIYWFIRIFYSKKIELYE